MKRRSEGDTKEKKKAAFRPGEGKPRRFFVLAILSILIFLCPALADSPTPSPSPAVSPSPSSTPRRYDSCGNHIHLSMDGLIEEPRKHLLYSHENGIIADGILMFTPLNAYVEREEIPSVSRGQFLSMKIRFDAYVESFSSKTQFYRKTEDDFLRVEGDDLTLSDLPDGTYLVSILCHAAHAGKAYSFCYLFWVE